MTTKATHTKKLKYKSEVFENVHESASALFRIGAIGKATMKDFDERCLASVPESMTPKQIKRVRESLNVSQPVFAQYLNTSASTVTQWETGAKKPNGIALRLLTIILKHGMKVLT